MSEGEKSIDLASEPVEEVKCAKCGCEIDVAGLEPFLRVECPDCGYVETVPVKFASFLLMDLVGTGGMGGVYAAKDEALGRFVAIKVMLKSLGDDQAFVDGFKKEAQAVAKLNHPHIAQIYSFGQVQGQPYIVMELVAGERLDKMIESGRPVDQGLVMRIGMEVAKGLAAAEEEGLIHGDVKPENILLDEKMHAKLVDFGLASYVNQAAGDGIWGTPYYIAPEKIKRQQADARSDMYSLGATLYHALAGRPPFEGATPTEVVKARLVAPPMPIHDYRPKVDQQAESIVLRMLDIQPAKRHPTYASLISDLRRSSEALCGKRRGFSKGGPKTRRLVVPKKTSSHVTPAPESPPSVHAGRERPRTTIRRRGGGTIRTQRGRQAQAAASKPPQATATATASATLADYRKRGTQGAAQGRQVDAVQKKKSSAGAWIATTFFTLLGIAGVVGFFYWRHQERIRVRTEAYEMREARKTAEERFEDMAAVQKAIAGLEAVAHEYVMRTTNAVYVVAGKGFDAKSYASPVADTNAVTRAASPAPSGTKEEVRRTPPAARPAPPGAGDNDTPDGIMSRAQLDALRNKKR